MAASSRVFVKKASLGSTNALLAGSVVLGLSITYAWRNRHHDPDDVNPALVPSPVEANTFRKAKLMSSRNVGAGAKVLKFRIEHGPGILPLRPFSHVNVQGVTMAVPNEYPFGLKVERPYTPISVSKQDFELLIKSYPIDPNSQTPAYKKGITSRFLLNLQPGQFVDVKGPIATTEDEVLREAVTHRKFVGMVCGGSGITPMIQVLARLTSSDSAKRYSLLWSNRSVEDIFFKKEMDHLSKIHKNVAVRYTLTRMAPPCWTHDTGRVSKEMLRSRMPPPSPDTVIVVCGPDSFVEAVAGGKKGRDGKWEGPIGGYLKELNYSLDHVIRL